MLGTAKLSPKTRGIKDIPERIRRLEAYECSTVPTKMDFAEIAGNDVWVQHQNNLECLKVLMHEAQALATKINAAVAKAYDERTKRLSGLDGVGCDVPEPDNLRSACGQDALRESF